MIIRAAHNIGMAQRLLTWLNKHTTSHQFLRCIYSFLLRIRLKHSPNYLLQYIEKIDLIV
jgi:hypothetical protein